MTESSTEASRMTRTELYAALTLWFAAFVFLDTTSGSGAFLTAASVVAAIVIYLLPVVLVVDVAFRFFRL
ncbi:hypothetical protein U3A55_08980 [Salarchaeum sp. III]|uniref:hypothetical protein n=1 Tax=Salarchaeum sp. III TaxID=3107927 RepID=UPI002ED9928F